MDANCKVIKKKLKSQISRVAIFLLCVPYIVSFAVYSCLPKMILQVYLLFVLL